MADPAQAAASTPAAPQGGATGQALPAGGGFTVPDGHRLVPDAEWQRTQDRLRGQHDYVERGKKSGFEKPDDFEKYGKFTGTLKQRGLTLDQLMSAFDSPADGAQAAADQGFNPAQIDKYLSERGYVTRETLDKERAFDKAEFEYKTEAQREEELRKAALAEFLGKDTPEDEREFWEAMAFRAFESKRVSPETLYPKDHPLAERYAVRPFREPEIKSVFAELATKRDQRKGAKLAALGGQTAKPGVTSTPAGSSASAPTKLPKSSDNDRRPGGLPPKAAVEAEFAKRQARRGGGTVSSMGG